MKYCKKISKKVGMMVTGMMAAAFMVSSAVSFASAATTVNDENKFVRNNFSVGTENGEEIVTKVDDTWNLVDMTGSSNTGVRESGSPYLWEIKSKETYSVTNIYRKKGSNIMINCNLTKGTKDDYVVVGIIEPDGTARAAKDVCAVGHTFDIDEDGYYSVFARNINSSTIGVRFTYFL